MAKIQKVQKETPEPIATKFCMPVLSRT